MEIPRCIYCNQPMIFEFLNGQGMWICVDRSHFPRVEYTNSTKEL